LEYIGFGMEWFGMEWFGMDYNGLEWNGMEWNGLSPDIIDLRPQDWVLMIMT
jgi:hypothetical protein